MFHLGVMRNRRGMIDDDERKLTKARLNPLIIGAAAAAPLVLPLLHLIWNLAGGAQAYRGGWGREKLLGLVITEAVGSYVVALVGAGLIALTLRQFKWRMSGRVIIPVAIVAGGLAALLFGLASGLAGGKAAKLVSDPRWALFVAFGGAAAAVTSISFCLMAGVLWLSPSAHSVASKDR
jgi:hypothetical protein